MFLGFPASSAGKESACNGRDLSSIPGLGRSPGEGNDYSLQYSGLENSMDCIVQWVTKSQTRLSDFHSLSPPPPQIFQRRIKRFGVRLHHLFKPIQQMTEEQQLHLGVYASPDRPAQHLACTRTALLGSLHSPNSVLLNSALHVFVFLFLKYKSDTL